MEEKPAAGTPGRLAMRVGLSMGVGLLLVWLLFRFGVLQPAGLLRALTGVRTVWLTAVLASTLLHFILTATKWRLCTGPMIDARSFYGGYFPYTALSALSAQFLPQQVSTLVVRSAALRLHATLPFGKSAVTTLYDQLYDISIPILLTPVALLAVFHRLVPWYVIGFGGFLLLAMGGIYALGGRYAFTLAFRTTKFLISRASNKIVPEDEWAYLGDRWLMVKMHALAVLRFFNLWLRVFFVALAFNLDVGAGAILAAFPLVSLSFLIGLTPAGLGIAEWSWVGMLVLFGVAPSVAGSFALGTRALTFVAVVIINLFTTPLLVCRGNRRRT
jgi:uncharacterized membrane protein YbhN (UPF0104 family)